MTTDSKRIAKNTIMLYVRMLLMMAVSLYTSRVILQVLGVDDYGIYHLVAGFVTFFSFISRALTSAIQRYLNVALGKGDKAYFRNIFSTSINIFILLSIIVIFVGETVGVWFVNTQLNIPEGRLDAVTWVFQLSLLVFIAGILRTPYNAAIIAHEKMNFYAYVSIFEVVIKLGVVFLLQFFDYDKLILYSLFLLSSIVVTNLVYYFYCRMFFPECSYRLLWDKKLFAEVLSLSGWSLMGQMAAVGRTQGENYVINRYHSVSANASKGISSQLTGALNQFVSNFQTAFNPQLIQTYAAGEMQEHVKLLYRACKFSYYLMLIIAIPTIFNLEFVLTTWLTVVPTYSIEFCMWGLISYLVLSLSSPLATSIFAEGNIRNYQIVLTVIHLSCLVTSYVVLRQGYAPYSIVIVGVVYQVLILFFRLYFNSKVCPIKVSRFSHNVLMPLFFSSCLSLILPLGLFWSDFNHNVGQNVIAYVVDIIWVAGMIYGVGLDKGEKTYVDSLLKKVLYCHLSK